MFASILREVVNAGYSRKEAEEAFNALWSEGYDFEDVEQSVKRVLGRLGVGVGWGVEEVGRKCENEGGFEERSEGEH